MFRGEEDSKFWLIVIGLIICFCFVAPAYADEQQDAMNSPDYLKYQWEISNFTQSNNQSSFWITNYKAPDLVLADINLFDHDSNEPVQFNYTLKTTLSGQETDSFWNLFGFFNPDSKLSRNEMCQIQFNVPVKNLEVHYGDVIKTHWGDI